MTLAQSWFCNSWGDIWFSFSSSFVSRANSMVIGAGGDDSVLSFFITFFPPNDFVLSPLPYSPVVFVGERVVSEVMW